MDCDKENKACIGGQAYLVYNYIMKNGIHSDKNYPYVQKREPCKKDVITKQKWYGQLKGYVFVKQGIKNLILAAALGPIAVTHKASKLFRFYNKGVYLGEGCDRVTDPDHAALLYGYNFNTPVPYLLFKNNWGTDFGE